MKTTTITLISVLASLAIVLRILKNIIFGTFQFINIPLVFVLFTSYYFGSKISSIIGILAFTISDLYIGVGIWTITNTLIVTSLSFLASLTRKIKSRIYLFIFFYLISLIYDILSSLILYIVFGLTFTNALLFSIIGLFIPIQGGYMIGIGPLTETSTALTTVLMIHGVRKRIKITDISPNTS